MTYINRRSPNWLAKWTLLLSILLFSFACSSDEKESLLLVNVPPATLPATASTMSITILMDGQQVAQSVVGTAQNPEGKYGFYLPASVSGMATVAVVVYDVSGCVVATGTGGPEPVAPGKKSGPVSVAIAPATVPCGAFDGGLPDATDSTGIDGGVKDTASGETALVVDGSPVGLDGAIPQGDARRDDGSMSDAPADGPVDVTVVADRPADLTTADVASPVEVGSDVLDASTDGEPTTLSIFRNCTEYTHTVTFSSGTIGDWPVLKLIFTPDGNNLISLGEDGRAKVWDVTPSGLAPNSRNLVFTGDSELTGTIRSDGKYLAIGERYGKVVIYDLPASLSAGAAVAQWELSPDDLDVAPWRALPRHFTTDGTHLVVAYSADSSPDPNLVVVWDVTTQQIVRSVPFDYDEWPMAALPGSYLDSMWVASAVQSYGDGGYETVVSLMDIGLATPTRTQVTLAGTVTTMAFTPDGAGLAIGMDSGEVSLWDISDKTKLVAPAAPLVPEVSGFYTEVYALSFTSDGRYLGVAGESSSSSVVKLVSVAPKQVIQKSVEYTPISLAFAPNNLAMAIGEYSYGAVLYCTP